MSQHSQIIRPLYEIMRRIEREIQAGGSLEGIKFYRKPEMNSEGRDDLPSLRPIDIAMTESRFQGQGGGDNGEKRRKNINAKPEYVFSLKLSTFAEDGFFAFVRGTDPKGVMDYMVPLLDAIEKDDNGDVDLLLAETCAEPFTYRIPENFPSDISWSVLLSIIYYPHPFIRGTRSDLVGE
jgi:hypothetical protein